MSAITYMGRSYGDATDWGAVLREAAKYPAGPSWLRSDLDLASGLAELAEQFKGLPYEKGIAEAALSIIETGTNTERAAVWQLPWERATRAIERLLRIVESDRSRLVEVRGVANVLWRLLQVHPKDARVLAALQEESRINPSDPWVRDMLATHLA